MPHFSPGWGGGWGFPVTSALRSTTNYPDCLLQVIGRYQLEVTVPFISIKSAMRFELPVEVFSFNILVKVCFG